MKLLRFFFAFAALFSFARHSSAQGLISDLTVQRTVTFQGEVTPPQITADQNDYSPTNLSKAAVLLLSSDASRNITGLAAGAKGRFLILQNIGTHDIVLNNESSSSSAANRFTLGADYTLSAAGGAILKYDITSTRWMMVASRSSAAGSASPTTTEGDLIVRGSSADQRLGIGSNTYVLTVDSTVSGKIKWAAAASGSGTVTNTAGSLTSNSPVLGAGSADTKTVAGITSDGTSKLILGVAGSSVGSIDFKNATSGAANLHPPTGALGAADITLPIGTVTLATLSNKLNGFAATTSAELAGTLSDESGTGFVAFTDSPLFTTQITTPKIVYTASVIERSGTGSPETVVTANIGSVFHRTDGTTGTTLYVKESGTGNTGWTAVASGGASGANPSGSITRTATNGVATTFMRSDATPPIATSFANQDLTTTSGVQHGTLGLGTSITGAHILDVQCTTGVASGFGDITGSGPLLYYNITASTSIDFLSRRDHPFTFKQQTAGTAMTINANATVTMNNTTASSSTTTGSLINSGGIGNAGALYNGGLLNVAGDLQLSKTITGSGTTGAQTINKNTGTVRFAAAASSLVVTNSLVGTNSVIICTVGSNDSTCKSVQAVAASGSFTIYPNAAPTAETIVYFHVTN